MDNTSHTDRFLLSPTGGEESPYLSQFGVDPGVTGTNRYSGLETTVAIILLGYLILGLSGNLLTIIALLRCPRVRNVTAAFIISLCVADCLFCVLVLPWEVSRFFAGKWVWGKGLICTVLPLIRYWNVAVSLLSIAMITLNRYIMIAHFGIYKSVYKKGWIGLMIAFCWLFPFCILLPTLFGKWGRFGMIEALETCSIIDEKGQSPKKVLFGLGFCVPALVIIICYSLIFYVIHKSDSRMRDHSTRAANGSAVSGAALQPKLPGKVDKETRRKKNEWRITKMVMIIFVTFVVTYLPITLVKFFDPLANYRALHLLGYVLVYLSCCINPVIYVIMNRQYRQAYRTVLMCKSPLLHTFTSHAEHSENEMAPMKNMVRTLNRLSFLSGWRASINFKENGGAKRGIKHVKSHGLPEKGEGKIKGLDNMALSIHGEGFERRDNVKRGSFSEREIQDEGKLVVSTQNAPNFSNCERNVICNKTSSQELRKVGTGECFKMEKATGSGYDKKLLALDRSERVQSPIKKESSVSNKAFNYQNRLTKISFLERSFSAEEPPNYEVDLEKGADIKSISADNVDLGVYSQSINFRNMASSHNPKVPELNRSLSQDPSECVADLEKESLCYDDGDLGVPKIIRVHSKTKTSDLEKKVVCKNTKVPENTETNRDGDSFKNTKIVKSSNKGKF